jgi:hypothetical protein
MTHRIVRYTVPASVAEAFPSDVADRLPHLERDGDGYTTLPRVHTASVSARLVHIGFEEHDLTAAYEIGWTRAAMSYDHGYTLHVTGQGDRRLVAVPHDDVEAQCGRYASGLYGYRLEPQ